MISVKTFVAGLKQAGIDFFTGVPDSLLKSFCGYLSDNMTVENHVLAANEGGALGIAAGHYLATGRPACVYMQNSGEGNVINPLASLTDKEVYGIPALLLIGWRGQPGVADEPQHKKQGRITLDLLDVMEIRHEVLAHTWEEASSQIARAAEVMRGGEVYVLVVEKDTFDNYKMQYTSAGALALGREEAIVEVAKAMDANDVVVSTTGMISRELFEYRAARGEGHERDFHVVGSMGHASQIALGIALAQPERRVWCLDGDGAVLMHMGSLAILGMSKPKNLVHVLLNNAAHESVGGVPTVANRVDIMMAVRNLGYRNSERICEIDHLRQALEWVKHEEGPSMLEVAVRCGHRSDLGRPTTTPAQNKQSFMDFLKQ